MSMLKQFLQEILRLLRKWYALSEYKAIECGKYTPPYIHQRVLFTEEAEEWTGMLKPVLYQPMLDGIKLDKHNGLFLIKVDFLGWDYHLNDSSEDDKKTTLKRHLSLFFRKKKQALVDSSELEFLMFVDKKSFVIAVPVNTIGYTYISKLRKAKSATHK